MTIMWRRSDPICKLTRNLFRNSFPNTINTRSKIIPQSSYKKRRIDDTWLDIKYTILCNGCEFLSLIFVIWHSAYFLLGIERIKRGIKEDLSTKPQSFSIFGGGVVYFFQSGFICFCLYIFLLFLLVLGIIL